MLGQLEQPFKDTFDVKKLRGDRILHWLMRDILLPVDDLESLAEKGILLIGHATHATPTLGGEGANSVITDAADLAEWISSHGVDGVRGFCEKMLEGWERKMKKSEENLKVMHSVSRSSL
jgi:2-polyprenyl-6-methoxyphenol hydroxylase-like FAD-dependent oxidoreductase